MERVLAQLRACADPSRLRLLAVCARGAFCVTELTEILGQSQPRLSRHLKLMVAAGLLDCSREGAHAWFSLAAVPFAEALLEALPASDPLRAADIRTTARVLAERARSASDRFRQTGADWDEMRALDLSADTVEAALLALLKIGPQPGSGLLGDVVDLGTGTGRLLELLAPHARRCLGIDASPAMLALARHRLSRPGLGHCRVRRADAYRLPLPEASADLVLAQMLLHHAEHPAAMLAEARRVLRPGGLLVVIDVEPDAGSAGRGWRWPGFSNDRMRALLTDAGLTPRAGTAIAGGLTVRLWPARLGAAAPLGSHAAELQPAASA